MADVVKIPESVSSIISEKDSNTIIKDKTIGSADNTLEVELQIVNQDLVNAQEVYNKTMNLEPLKSQQTSNEVSGFSLYEKATQNFLTFIKPKS